MKKINQIEIEKDGVIETYEVSLTEEEGKNVVDKQLLTKTAVPNNEYVDKVYFNTSKTEEEVVDILSSITYVSGSYAVFHSEDKKISLLAYKSSVDYGISLLTTEKLEVIFKFGGNYTDFTGWNPNIQNPITLNAISLTENTDDLGTYAIGDQNELLKDLVYVLNEKYSKEDALYTIGGETVPNTGYVDKVYLNTKLSVDEVKALLDTCPYNSALQGNFAPILANSQNTIALAGTNSEGHVILNVITNEFYFVYIDGVSELEGVGFSGWNPNFNGVIEVNDNVLSDFNFEGLNIEMGLANEQFNGLFSIAPFKKVEKYLTKSKVNDVVKNNLFEIKNNLALPVIGYLDKVYFNTNLTNEEVESLFYEVFPNTPSITEQFIAVDKTYTRLISFFKGDGARSEGLKIRFRVGEEVTILWANETASEALGISAGWQNFINPIEYNAELIPFSSSEINEKLKKIMYYNVNREIYTTKEAVEEYVYNFIPKAIPNNDIVYRVYFNTKLTPTEVDAYLSKLTYVDFNGISVNVLFSNETLTNVLFVHKSSSGVYNINHSTDIATMQYTNIYNSNVGWNYDEWEIKEMGISESTGITIGAENEIIKDVVNIGFEKQDKYATNDELREIIKALEARIAALEGNS